MHADYLNITVPLDFRESVHDAVLPIITELLYFPDSLGVYRSPVTTGTFDCRLKYGTASFSASGGFLELVRTTGALSNLLWAFAEVPHRVTRLDVAHDLPVDSPKIISNFYRRAKAGQITLTNRPIRPDQVTKYIRPSLYGGADTGTVYMGCDKIQVAGLKIYDKRNERLDRTGIDIGASTRFELKLGRKAGVSLRDVFAPEAVFWHFMAPLLPHHPKPLPVWDSAAEGYSLPDRVISLPAEALKRAVEASPVLGDWHRLAQQIGSSGTRYLLSLLERRLDSITHSQSETGISPSATRRAADGVPVRQAHGDA